MDVDDWTTQLEAVADRFEPHVHAASKLSTAYTPGTPVLQILCKDDQYWKHGYIIILTLASVIIVDHIRCSLEYLKYTCVTHSENRVPRGARTNSQRWTFAVRRVSIRRIAISMGSERRSWCRTLC